MSVFIKKFYIISKVSYMLYWKYSPNRIFFLNEYWLLIPSAILANYFAVRYIRGQKKRNKDLEKIIDQIERHKRVKRIIYLALGLDRHGLSQFRGGDDVVDVSYIKCLAEAEDGLRFLDNDRVRKIIHQLYRHKRKGKIIYITATAVCHIVNQYGLTFLALPVAIGDFGLTNLYQTARKVVATVLLSGVGPLFVIGTPVSLGSAFIVLTVGFRLAFNNLDFISTSPITGSVENLKPRIADVNDVVVINNRDKIVMTNPGPEKKQCWLGDQALFNSDCKVKPTEIPNTIDLASQNLNLDYKKDVVNMQDVTGLDRIDFSDVLDLGQAEDLGQAKPRKGTMVNFLDKYGDSGPLEEIDTWDASTSRSSGRLREYKLRGEL